MRISFIKFFKIGVIGGLEISIRLVIWIGSLIIIGIIAC